MNNISTSVKLYWIGDWLIMTASNMSIESE
jgi:hypothetical protein